MLTLKVLCHLDLHPLISNTSLSEACKPEKLYFLNLCYLLVLHETAAGALWNLAFYSCNSLCIVENGGVPVLGTCAHFHIKKWPGSWLH